MDPHRGPDRGAIQLARMPRPQFCHPGGQVGTCTYKPLITARERGVSEHEPNASPSLSELEDVSSFLRKILESAGTWILSSQPWIQMQRSWENNHLPFLICY